MAKRYLHVTNMSRQVGRVFRDNVAVICISMLKRRYRSRVGASLLSPAAYDAYLECQIRRERVLARLREYRRSQSAKVRAPPRTRIQDPTTSLLERDSGAPRRPARGFCIRARRLREAP
jgi:hypothetical protein